MKNQIEWHQAQQLPELREQQQEKAINNFLDENCEMATGADLQYWSEATGKGLDWIIETGKNIKPEIKEIYYFDGSLDAVW